MKLVSTVAFKFCVALSYIKHGVEIEGFLFVPQPARTSIEMFHKRSTRLSWSSIYVGNCRTRSSRLLMSPLNDEDEEDDEDDEEIDVDALGDWRAFRMNLAEGQGKESGRGESKIVSKLNEELLKTQNSALAEEYVTKAWAHETPQPEVGGLVCRLPVEAEIYRNKASRLGKRLQDRLNLDDTRYGSEYEDRRMMASEEDIVETDMEGASAGVSFSPLAAKTVFWYRAAQKLVKEEMARIQKSANARNEIDASKLSPEALDVLKMYMDNQSAWQEVCLVVDQDVDAGTCTTVVLNRPIATKVNEDLAKLVLFGQFSRHSSALETQRLVNFLNAFEDSCALYVGGPDEQDEPATLIHGIKGLPGAVEISPGTSIYKGGLDAAVQGVMAGKYDPLEFRFFVGRHSYKDSALQKMVYSGKYQPVACARTLALKQCIQLPKPLWNEVLEMCGGELKEISKLELLKRDDIQIEEIDDDEYQSWEGEDEDN